MGKKRDLEFINIMNKDGTMSANAQAYAGLDRAECRVKIWEDLEKDGLAIKKEDYETRVPRSQRGGEVIEPMVSEQWFCKMETMSTPALNALKTGELTIVPKRFEKVYETWLSDCKDWCISRQLWWGHRIPVWYVHDSIEDLQNAKKGEGKGASKKYVVAKNDKMHEPKPRRNMARRLFCTEMKTCWTRGFRAVCGRFQPWVGRMKTLRISGSIFPGLCWKLDTIFCSFGWRE